MFKGSEGSTGYRGFLSYLADSVASMEVREMTLLFAAAGLTINIVYEGSADGCPHCDDRTSAGLAEAA